MKDIALKKLNCILLSLLAVGFTIALVGAIRSGIGLEVRNFTGLEKPLGGWQMLDNGALQPPVLPPQGGVAGQMTLVARLDDPGIAQGTVNLLHCKTDPGTMMVSVGGRTVYSCVELGQGLMTIGSVRDHYISIDAADFGAPVYITLRSLPGRESMALQSVLLTTRAGALMQASLEHFWRGCLGLAMLMAGLMLALVYCIMLRYVQYPPMLWLGLFLICYAIWNNAYIHTLLALLSDRWLYYLLLYVLVGLAGVSWLMFAFYVGKKRHTRLFNVLIALLLLSLVTAFGVCVLRPYDRFWHFWLPDTVVVAAAAISLVVLLADYRRYRELSRPMAVGAAGAAAGVAAGILSALLGQDGCAGLAVDLGLLFFTACFTVGLISNGIDALVQESRLHTLELAAYRDQLTGCENRRSFDQRLEAYRCGNNADALTNLAIVMFDSNNLKMVNDTYGHARGDQLLIDTADALRRYLGNVGAVYRIGGDEFVVVCDVSSLPTLGMALDAFDREANSSTEAGIDVSWGVAYYKSGLDSDPESVLMRAERRMYAYKKGCKQ